MGVVAASSLAPHQSAHRGWGLVGGARNRVGLLDGAWPSLSHTTDWRGVTPRPFATDIIFFQCLLLSQRGAQSPAFTAPREHLRPPGQFGIHGRCPTVGVSRVLLPVEGVRTRAPRIGALSPHHPCMLHVGRVVVHGPWRSTLHAPLHHPGVHVGHHHPARVKVHGQGLGATAHGALWRVLKGP